MARVRPLWFRIGVSGFLVGALLTASSLAGVVVDPLGIGSDGALGPDPTALEQADDQAAVALDAAGTAATVGAPGGADAGDHELLPDEVPGVLAADITAPSGPRVRRGFLVGAARASLYPAPEVFGGPGDEWQTEGCTDVDAGQLDVDHAVSSLEDIHGWPAASPNCIYLGGFGIGPVRPAERVGFGGVWVRAVAVSNGEKTFVYAIADTVGWFARYDADVCPTDDCGILDVREAAATDLGVPVSDVIVGSTHTHAGADTYGGWGGIPTWYRAQLRDATVAAVKQAVANLEPARVTVGESILGHRNNERRDTYYSTSDTGAPWLHARDGDGDVIATWLTFAAHPTHVDEQILHADWPGATARRFEAAYPGSVGVVFEGGLGNVSARGGDGATDEEKAETAGLGIADDVIVDIRDRRGAAPAHNDMASIATTVTHPAMTNPGLLTLASAGLFDREFTPGTKGAGLPGSYYWSKKGELSTSPGEDNDPNVNPAGNKEFASGCSSSGPTVITVAGAHRIGDVAVAFGPGELFSNLAEAVKERANHARTTVVLGQTNDALGYIIQSFEFDEAANAATDIVTQTNEYEEVFSIDRCFGDHVLETMLEATRGLGFDG